MIGTQYLKLCLVTNLKEKSFDDYKPLIIKAIRGGVTAVQLREKRTNLDHIFQLATQLKQVLKPFNIPLIINDYVDIAKEVGAEGVHIGQSDMTPQEARKKLGFGKIIGLSIETLEELEIANQLTCIDYVAASAVFHSKTKSNCKTIWGVEGLQMLVQRSKYPVMAIGGINSHNIENIMGSGACGVAVVGAIHDHENAEIASKELINKINDTMLREEPSFARKYR